MTGLETDLHRGTPPPGKWKKTVKSVMKRYKERKDKEGKRDREIEGKRER